MERFLKTVPVPTAGLALGLAALGNALASFAPGSGALTVFFEAVALALLVLLLAKVVRCPQTVRADFASSIVASVSATFCMASMQVASFAHAFVPHAALVAWLLAVAAHVVLIVWFTCTFITRFKLSDVYPTYFICYVGIVVASLTSPTFGCEALGRVACAFGAACYAVLLVVVTLRYARHQVPEGARPLFCIYAAPMSLSLAGYLAVFSQPNVVLVAVLAVLAQLLFLLVLTRLPHFLRLPFYPSYAAMTFPFVITAVALRSALSCLTKAGVLLPGVFEILANVEFAFAAVMVCYVALRYGLHFAAQWRAAQAVAEA